MYLRSQGVTRPIILAVASAFRVPLSPAPTLLINQALNSATPIVRLKLIENELRGMDSETNPPVAES